MIPPRDRDTESVYEFTVCESFSQIDRNAWDRLLTGMSEATIFQEFDWLNAWWDSIGSQRGDLKLCIVLTGSEVVAIAPLFIDNRNGELRFVGYPHSDYTNFIYSDVHSEVVRPLLDFVLGLGINKINLAELPSYSRLSVCLQNAHLPRTRQRSTVCPARSLSAESVGEVRAKQSFRRISNRLHRAGNVTTRHLTSYKDIKPLLPVFFKMHMERWANTAYPSLFHSETDRIFYDRVAETMCPDHRVLFTLLECDSIPIACHFGLQSDRRFIWYKPSYNIAWAYYSPGKYMLAELIFYAYEQGYTTFDFTRGDEGFKRRFANIIETNQSYLIRRRRDYRSKLGHSLKLAVRRRLRW